MDHSLAKYLDDLTGKVMVRRDEEKIIFKVPAERSKTGALFVKIYMHPGLLPRLRNGLCGRTPGRRDYQICRKLHQTGLSVSSPIGFYNDHPNIFAARRSLFAAQWLDCESLASLVNRELRHVTHTSRQPESAAAYAALLNDRERFRTLSFRLGAFIATLHNKGVFSKDLNVGNILVRPSTLSVAEFFLVDYENTGFGLHIGRKKSLRNIIQVCASMMLIDAAVYEDLLQGYDKVRPEINLLRQKAFVQGKANRLQSLWKGKIDGNFERIADHLKNQEK